MAPPAALLTWHHPPSLFYPATWRVTRGGGHAADVGRPQGSRIARLGRLERGFAREVALQRGTEGVLLFGERRQYLKAIQDALAGAEAGRVVLAGVVKRVERG